MGRKSNYENGMYQQLMEIMGRLDTVEKNAGMKQKGSAIHPDRAMCQNM